MHEHNADATAKARILTRNRLGIELATVTAFAALTALGARAQVHLPFTPVPITGQVFCVLLAGAAARGGTRRSIVFAACICGVAVIYLFGAAWYAVWTSITGTAVAFAVVLAQSVYPFALIDAAKAAVAAAAAPALSRRLPHD
jgi:biotin transporter BioY